ncbi:MAG: hypothetical protein KDD41_09115 [Flavobacteriales bacterium]|nr:hypothetical protein [Flavobacteriales bacterium]
MLTTAVDVFGYEQFFPAKISEDIQLDGYRIIDAYELDSDFKILIGRPEIETSENEGLRIIVLKDDAISFIGDKQGESYIYRPTFYKESNNVIIICELGTEYSWGFDAYLFTNSTLNKIGFFNLGAAINKIDHPESAIPLLRIRALKKDIFFDFPPTLIYETYDAETIDLIYKPGQKESEIIPLDSINYIYNESEGLVMNKSNR